jgi:hypothetical protein
VQTDVLPEVRATGNPEVDVAVTVIEPVAKGCDGIAANVMV